MEINYWKHKHIERKRWKERKATDRTINKQICHEVDDDVCDIGADVAPALAVPSQQQLQQAQCGDGKEERGKWRRGSWFESK